MKSGAGLMAGLGLILLLCAAARAQSAGGEQLAKDNDCYSCHAAHRQMVGPPWSAIAQHYSDNPQVEHILVDKIIHGAVGDWGQTPMPPHPDLSAGDALSMVKWILSVSGPLKHRSETYSYKTSDGKTVVVHFPVFVAPKQDKVTPELAHGYEQYGTYCARCHGPDAQPTGFTPDLQAALREGVNRKDFLTTTMEGRTGKGMPKWAGTLTADEMNEIYDYIKARALGLVSPGAPPTD
ncbi:MAG TPA: c-type cytochrome [Candidatus Binataceae bacterium]|nr:c-type cytochrome [Candidatus Binataceae bacterium]